MSYSLVIIDMQPEFKAAKGKRVYNAVMCEIKQAIKKRAAIVFVEFGNYNEVPHTRTRKGLRLATSKYDRVFTTVKLQNDGGDKIMNMIVKNNLSRKIRVCGVNTDACVVSSVRGMVRASEKKVKINVIADGCATAFGEEAHEAYLQLMGKLSNVKIERDK